jgi:hypothetical protein
LLLSKKWIFYRQDKTPVTRIVVVDDTTAKLIIPVAAWLPSNLNFSLLPRRRVFVRHSRTFLAGIDHFGPQWMPDNE